MSKVSYASLKLKSNEEIKTIKFNDTEIEVLQYLPVEEKYSFINIVLQQSLEDKIFNPIKIDLYFHLYLIYEYSNLSFTEKQKEDELKIYDALNSSGLMDLILQAIPETEYNQLLQYLYDLMDELDDYNHSVLGILLNVMNSLPVKAEELNNMLANFDMDKFKNVIDFAKAANGGREIR